MMSEPLTYDQLSTQDDILTDVLIDHAYYWTSIKKNKPRYQSSRSVKEEQICDIIRKHVIGARDAQAAMKQLLALPYLKSYRDRLRSDAEKAAFRQHLEKYVSIYLPDCPFEVNSTNRYTITTHEACITARVDIPKGEKIKYLTGHRVAVDKDKLLELEKSGQNFSIVTSAHSGITALFLGPARFANHDCNPNATLSAVGSSRMEIVAKHHIYAGEEITVSYGDHYFYDEESDRNWCLCATCEYMQSNGWNDGHTVDHREFMKRMAQEDQGVDEADLGYSTRSTRSNRPTGSKRKYFFEPHQRGDTPNSKRRKPTPTNADGTTSSSDSRSRSSRSASSAIVQSSTPATTIGDEDEADVEAKVEAEVETEVEVEPEAETEAEAEADSQANVHMVSAPAATGTLQKVAAPTIRRYPNDYITSPGLLSEPGSGWVECDTCENKWIQSNAYEPNIECPRCERHSKLYGWAWPKTQRSGPKDDDEFFVDHREVNRKKGERKKWDTDEYRAQLVQGAGKAAGLWSRWKPLGEGEASKKKKRTKKEDQEKQKEKVLQKTVADKVTKKTSNQSGGKATGRGRR